MTQPEERRTEKVKYKIIDFSCVTCTKAIKKRLDKMNGVEDVRTNPILNEIYIYFDPSVTGPEKIEDEVKRTGYKAIRERS
ncbi:MAG: heavy-metal-associated domain-containing protein [Nitrososphaerota archaeon]|jgi:copper chaperone CopZ|nr:heavy-metal-associated domain-containing protein [Nitrososphaerota archaeon]